MKKTISILLVSLFALTIPFAQTAQETIDSKMGLFLDELNKSIPDNAVSGTTWSDAYIGSIIGVPPHFGIGAMTTFTKFDTSSLQPLLDLFGVSTPIPGMPLPAYAIDARIGGLILPFDVGARFGYLPSTTISGVTFDYLTFGADVRFCLMKEGIIKPNISIGAGYYFEKFGLSYTYKPTVNYGGYSAALDPMTVSVGTNSNIFDFKAQISKSLLIFTPYVGIAESVALSNSTYDFAGLFSGSRNSGTTYGTRLYGGLSLNILLLKINLSGSYNLINQNWGLNAGLRVQL